jgi:hypothetical protein
MVASPTASKSIAIILQTQQGVVSEQIGQHIIREH